MNRLVPRGLLLFLMVAAVGLPVAVVVCLALSALLGAMGDAVGRNILWYAAWTGGALWAADLVLLLLTLGLDRWSDREP